jgi:hypothetical protein
MSECLQCDIGRSRSEGTPPTTVQVCSLLVRAQRPDRGRCRTDRLPALHRRLLPGALRQFLRDYRWELCDYARARVFFAPPPPRQCQACSTGRFGNGTELSACFPCPIGRSASRQGLTACEGNAAR